VHQHLGYDVGLVLMLMLMLLLWEENIDM